jgi:hypothetical protein
MGLREATPKNAPVVDEAVLSILGWTQTIQLKPNLEVGFFSH